MDRLIQGKITEDGLRQEFEATVLGSDSHPSWAPGQESFDLAPLGGIQFVPFHVSPLSLRWTYTLLLRTLILPL